jgi:hypothetical protein
MGPNRAILSVKEGDGKIVETTSFGRRSAHRGTILQGTEGTPLALHSPKTTTACTSSTTVTTPSSCPAQDSVAADLQFSMCG